MSNQTTTTAIWGDVHANINALEAFWEMFEEQPEIGHWFLGDAVGYGHKPQEVLDKLASEIRPTYALRGNHDAALLYLKWNYDIPGTVYFPTREWNDAAVSTIRRHYNSLDNGYLEYLRDLGQIRLRLPAPRDYIFLAHGRYGPNDHASLLTYVDKYQTLEVDYVNNRDWGEAARAGRFVLTIYGHTHEPQFCCRPANKPSDHLGRAWEYLPLPFEQPVVLEPGYVYHLNPGSLGFPKREDTQGNTRPSGQPDGRYWPTYAVLTEKLVKESDEGEEKIESAQVQMYQLIYNVEQARQDMREAGYPPEVLGWLGGEA